MEKNKTAKPICTLWYKETFKKRVELKENPRTPTAYEFAKKNVQGMKIMTESNSSANLF